MATYVGLDEATARALLASAGTEIAAVADEDAVVAAVLVQGERQVRATATLEPPTEGGATDGMDAWHRNAAREAHTVTDGVGLMQFVTDGGVVTVRLEAGDVLVNRGVEHRYLPLTPQGWVLRWSGPADADLGATDTGRPAEPWPAG